MTKLYENTLCLPGKRLEETDYMTWSPDEPNSDLAFCGAMTRTGDDENIGYDDIWCTAEVAFICEKSPESLIDVHFHLNNENEEIVY